MKTKKITVDSVDKFFKIKVMKTFLWNLESENEKNNGKIELIFTRDESVPYIKKIKKLESKFYNYSIPMILCMVPTFGAFVFITVFFIKFLVQKDTFDLANGFIDYFLPAAGLLVLTVVLTGFKMKRMKNFIENKDNLVKEAQNKVKEIVDSYGEENNSKDN